VHEQYWKSIAQLETTTEAYVRLNATTNDKTVLGLVQEKVKAARKECKPPRRNTRWQVQEGAFETNLDKIFNKHGVYHKHYQGGTSEGGACRNAMGNAHRLLKDIIALSRKMIRSNDELEAHLAKFEQLLGLLDGIWSEVRHISGMIPNEEFLEQLADEISGARRLWIDLISCLSKAQTLI